MYIPLILYILYSLYLLLSKKKDMYMIHNLTNGTHNQTVIANQ